MLMEWWSASLHRFSNSWCSFVQRVNDEGIFTMHFLDTTFYNNLDSNDPATIVQNRVNKFAEKIKSILTNNEYEFLTKLFNQSLFMLPKLHKANKIY